MKTHTRGVSKAKMKVGIVIYRNCTSSMVTGFWDILSTGNQLHRMQTGSDFFHLELIAHTRAAINSFSGLKFEPHRTTRSKTGYDLIYVPGFIGDTDEVRKENAATIAWLGKMGKGKAILTAACNGNFLLAESGVLRNKRATTHWSVAQKFMNDYKDIVLQPEKIIVDNGKSISAAGVTAYNNLALYIVQRFVSADVSLSCAKIFLVDAGRKIQTPYQIFEFSRTHGDEVVLRAQDWMEGHFSEKISAEQLADVVRMGKKTFFRRFKKATGENPQHYLQKLRMERAKRLLESKDITFSEVTWEVGYRDASSFHKAFKIETGLTPMDYRDKFYFGAN